MIEFLIIIILLIIMTLCCFDLKDCVCLLFNRQKRLAMLFTKTRLIFRIILKVINIILAFVICCFVLKYIDNKYKDIQEQIWQSSQEHINCAIKVSEKYNELSGKELTNKIQSICKEYHTTTRDEV